MPTDPNIILAAGDIQGPKQPDVMSMYAFAQQVKAAQQDTAQKNALLQVFADPNSIDASGSITPQALKRVYAADPETGVKLQGEALENQVRKAQIEHSKTEVGKNNFDFMSTAAGVGYDAYEDAKRAGKSEADAISMGQAARNEAADNNGGVVGDDVVTGIKGSPFNPAGAKALAGTNKEWATRRQQGVKDDLDAQKLKDTEAKDAATEKARLAQEAEQARRDDALISAGHDKGWSDPYTTKDGKTVSINKTTGDVREINVEGLKKVGAPGTARSPATMAAQKYVEEHPDATAEDIAQFAADYGKTGKSVAAFSTGKQGDMLRSFNVAISHLNTLDGLVDALGNNDTQLLNKAKSAFKSQFGDDAPTNFDAAKSVVGDEIIKAIIGGGGALADRENAQNQINRAESPAQLKGVIKTYKELMGGQLKGLKKQYTDTTGRNDFDERLSPETKAQLGIDDAAPPKKSAPVDHSKLSDEDLKKKLGIQ